MFSGLTFFGIPVTWFLRGLELTIILILVMAIYLMLRVTYYSAALRRRRKRAKVFQFPSKRI